MVGWLARKANYCFGFRHITRLCDGRETRRLLEKERRRLIVMTSAGEINGQNVIDRNRTNCLDSLLFWLVTEWYIIVSGPIFFFFVFCDISLFSCCDMYSYGQCVWNPHEGHALLINGRAISLDIILHCHQPSEPKYMSYRRKYYLHKLVSE